MLLKVKKCFIHSTLQYVKLEHLRICQLVFISSTTVIIVESLPIALCVVIIYKDQCINSTDEPVLSKQQEKNKKKSFKKGDIALSETHLSKTPETFIISAVLDAALECGSIVELCDLARTKILIHGDGFSVVVNHFLIY